MADFAQTGYAKNGTVHIAYQVMGNGPLDLVLVPGFISHLELQLDDPRPIRFFERCPPFAGWFASTSEALASQTEPERSRRLKNAWMMCVRSWTLLGRNGRHSLASPRVVR